MTPVSALRPLFDYGVRVLSSEFWYHEGRWDIHHSLDDAACEHLVKHDVWKHFESGLLFSINDIVCNLVPLEQISGVFEPLAKDPNRAEIMDLLTHEQYFWPFYVNYIPDHFQRIEAAIRWVTEHGYKPVFFHEGFLGGQM
jgi:hypothetical protein